MPSSSASRTSIEAEAKSNNEDARVVSAHKSKTIYQAIRQKSPGSAIPARPNRQSHNLRPKSP